jgi:hypothetical protein
MTKWTMADVPSLHGRVAVVTGANSAESNHRFKRRGQNGA